MEEAPIIINIDESSISNGFGIVLTYLLGSYLYSITAVTAISILGSTRCVKYQESNCYITAHE